MAFVKEKARFTTDFSLELLQILTQCQYSELSVCTAKAVGPKQNELCPLKLK